MTARGDRDKDAFLHAGFTDYIYKPFSSSELLSLLSMIKTNRNAEEQNIDFSMILSEVKDKSKTLAGQRAGVAEPDQTCSTGHGNTNTEYESIGYGNPFMYE